MKLFHYLASPDVLANKANLVIMLHRRLFQAAASVDFPSIRIFNGLRQSFGTIGQPQRWVNICGNVSDQDGISSLSYSLNGGPAFPLSIGPDGCRLVAPGDFNIELLFSELQVGRNMLVVSAKDGAGQRTTEKVSIDYAGPKVWPRNYTTDWASATQISEQAQIVDGLWALEGDSVRPVVPGYDRLLAVGDESWDDYEATVPITVHGFDPQCKGVYSRQCRSDPGVGMLLRWQGHTETDGSQPRRGYTPFGVLGWMRWSIDNLNNDSLVLTGTQGCISRLTNKSLPFEIKHLLKMRVETNAHGHTYSVKIWEDGRAEPAAWDIQSRQALSEGLRNGSLLLLAHHVDASFGNVTITPLKD
jgi:hypothetical protein